MVRGCQYCKGNTLIQFCCPACCVSLSVKESVAGGQVNCPKCQKLILIPAASPFGDVQDPFLAETMHKGVSVAKAVAVSVEPYRKELESKTELLNDAVEMVKTRNNRIREVESLLLRVQKDLWELEVVYDGEKEDYLRSQAERKRLKQQIEEIESAQPDTRVLEERFETTLKSLSFAHEQLGEIRQRSQSFEEALETLQTLETQLDAELERLGGGDSMIREMGQVFRDAVDLLNKSSKRIRELEESQLDLVRRNESLDARRAELKVLLRDAINQIETVQ
jgi:chromosome segregation ATPase